MIFFKHSINLSTQSPIEQIDITNQIEKNISDSKFLNGFVLVASHHTTAGIAINEKCNELEKDFLAFTKQLAPPQAGYAHDKVAVDGRPNAHSHLLSYLLKTSETIAVINGKMQLGTWQRVFFIELDGPREKREVQITFLGNT